MRHPRRGELDQYEKEDGKVENSLVVAGFRARCGMRKSDRRFCRYVAIAESNAYSGEKNLMKRLVLTIAFLAGCAAFCNTRTALAQETRMSRPTISPYLNLYRQDGAAVDNYNAFVRPEIELRAAMGRQQAALTRQATNVLSLQQHVSRESAAATQARTTASVFMHFGHYFPLRESAMSRRNIGRRR